MAHVPQQTVLFQEKSTELGAVTRLVDLLLTIWICVDDLEGHLAKEVEYLRKVRGKDRYEEDDYEFGGNGMAGIVVAFTTGRNNDEASDQERLLRTVFKEIRYQPNVNAMNQIGTFLENLLEVNSKWRENTTKAWHLDGCQHEDIFRFLVWMVREYEEIIKAFFAVCPNDTNMLLYLQNIRKNIFREAKEFENLTSDRQAFHRMLGTGKYFVSPLLTTFWEQIEHPYDKKKVASNPIDEKFTEPTKLLQLFSEISLAINSKMRANRSIVAKQLYLNKLISRLESLNNTWVSVFETYFFLGPTITLLKNTVSFFQDIRPLILSDEEELSDAETKYRDSIIAYIEKFESAANSLAESLTATNNQDKTSTTPD